jgi:hypothetical protein
MPLSPCEPDLNESSVGWLASSPPDYPYRIGVVGRGPDDAKRRFQDAVAAWGELHDRGTNED